MSESWITDEMIEAGAKALYGDGWETTATIANKKYCREKAKDVFLAVYRAYVESKVLYGPQDKHF
jgi:hypothetical protein